MQIEHSRSHFQQLNAEPRSASSPFSAFPGGPPPSYRSSSTNADDNITFSSTRSSTVTATIKPIKRRNSWTNLIENNENTCKNDLSYHTEPLRTANPKTANSDNTVMPACCTWTTNIYDNYQSLEKYNLNGRYAKHFIPFYVLNSVGDPIAISKLELTNCGSLCKLNSAEEFSASCLKRDRMSGLRQWFQEPKNKSYAFILLFLIIICCILTAISYFHEDLTQEPRKFSWMPPLIFRNQQGNSTTVRMYQNDHQVRFEILGNLPIKNNYVAIYDFRERRIAIIDLTLKDNGKNLICFVTNMNISTMPDKYSLEIGAQNAFKRKEQIHGWEETWNFLPGSFFGNSSILFNPPISECDSARWIFLNYTESDQRGQKCSDCYDFCLPELGIERDYLRAEIFLNIIRRICFYLFVPEWRFFAAAYSGKQNQHDFKQFYYQGLNRINSGNGSRNIINNNGNRFNEIQNVIDGIVQPITDQYRNFESKWISLQKIPQQISNPVSQAMSQMIKTESNVESSPSVIQSISGNGNYQQQNTEHAYTGNMPSSIYSGNVRHQNNASESINNVEQFTLPTKYNRQPNSFNTQLSTGQMFNDRPNTMSVDNRDDQQKSIYDHSIRNTSLYGEIIPKQSNYYTQQPGIDIYIQQPAANPNQNDQDNGPRN
ncbi:BRICHOS domain-containing protein [Dirofilaria immitis]